MFIPKKGIDMGKQFRFIKNLSSYTFLERLGIVSLFIILLIIAAIPSFLPKKSLDADELTQLKTKVDDFERKLAAQLEKENCAELFLFNPNALDSIGFRRLGFTPSQTSVILRYRAKGGVFRTTDDFKQIYVVSDSAFNRLKPYIHIVKQKPESIKVIELNTADTVKLIELKGIGAYYAKKIIERREKLGGFVSVNQLLEINGFDDEKLSQLKQFISVDTVYIRKINLNTVRAGDLRKHPYFDTQVVNKIVKYRKLNGRINSIHELIDKDIITAQQSEKIKAYIMF